MPAKKGKHMKTIRESLIESAREQFYLKGYDKASLRTICTNANVTTGALYSSFRSKEDLLSEVLKNTIAESFAFIDSIIPELFEKGGELDVRDMVSFLYDRKKDFHILFYGCNNTRFESYRDTLYEKAEDIFSASFARYGIEPDNRLVSLITKKSLDVYIDLIGAGYSLEDSIILAKSINAYSRAGLMELIKG